MPRLWARPHSSEVITKASVAHTNSLRSPKRRLSQPVSGSAIAVLTANEVMTHVACCELAPRLPAMVGSETLAMVVSSTCMNEAIAKPTVQRATLGGRKPAAAPGAAGAPGEPGAAGACADMADLSSTWTAAAG